MSKSIFNKSFVTWVINKTQFMSEEEARFFLSEKEWEEFHGCCEQRVFKKKGVPFVIKITYEGFWKQESFKKEVPIRWERAKEHKLKEYFAETIVVPQKNFVLSFQEKLIVPDGITFAWRKGLIQKLTEIINGTMGVFFDIRTRNVGVDSRGKLKVFDFQNDQFIY